MNYSSDVVADAVRAYWKTYYPRTVIAFFYQKYEHDLEWEWCEELVECNASDDYETVIFQNDFCEGQTCVKDISIVPLEDIIDYYTEKHIKCLSLTYTDVPDNNVGDMISRQEAMKLLQDDWQASESRGDDERAEIAKWHYIGISNLPPVQPEVAKDTNVPSTDTISRQAAIDALTGIEFCHYMEFGEYIGENTREVRLIRAEKAQDALQNLPSAQPERDTPKRVLWTGWKGHRYTRYNCPNCKKPVRNDDVYCHRCGQRLMFPKVSHTPYVEGQKQEVIVRWDDE